uniref:NLR family CARD domain-containing protein 3 n=1 Tax=Centroberyx gerrardi TaxID=166262 RepID=UPI003AB053FC
MEDTEIETISTPSGSSSFEEGVSAGGRSASIEDDDIYYVPERRPSLDLGPDPTPMDTSSWWHVEQAAPPALSYTSMNSEGFHKAVEMDGEDDSSTRVHLERTDSYSSCYSLDSDDCEKRTRKVRNKEDDISEPPERPELIRDPNEIRHPSLTVGFTFKAISKTLAKLSELELRRFKATLWKRYPESFNTPPQGMDMVDLVDRLLECYDLEVSLQLTKALLEEMRLHHLIRYLQDLRIKNEVRFELSVTLKRKYGEVQEAMQAEKQTLDSLFTNLYITTTWDNGPNTQHEVRQLENLNTNRKPEKQLSCTDILSIDMIQSQRVKSVMTVGMPGTGKTMAVQKLIQEWAEERTHPHISFLFPLPFRELNTFEGSEISLVDIIHTLYPETKKLKKLASDDEGKIMLVCDGLDEYPHKLDFYNTELRCDHEQRTSLNVLVVNLLRGRLFYNTIVWITSRPLKSRSFPGDVSHEVFEVRGFNDAQKEEYFKKRFEDPAQADRVIAHLSSCKTLHIMCHLPLFCSVLSGAFQHAFSERGSQAELPRSITHVYTQLLLVLLRGRRFRAPPRSSEEEREFLMKLGKVAFVLLEKSQVRISKSYWKDSGLTTEEAVVNSGLCTEFILEQYILLHERVQCFIHSTLQEYMAALYVFLSFRNHGKNALDNAKKAKISRIFKAHRVMELYKSAVERSLLCEDGRLDIFLRFLLGMALNANQELLQPYFTTSVKWPSVIEDAATLIRKSMRENVHPDRKANLQHCLEELGVGASESTV